MGFVQGCRMINKLHTLHTLSDRFSIINGPYHGSEGRFPDVQAKYIKATLRQGPDQSLTQVTCTACYQNFHNREI